MSDVAPVPRNATRSYVLAAVLALVAVAMLVVATLWFVRAHQLRSVPAADNDAMVAASTTGRVEADVSTALTRVLTYDYAKPEATKAAASQMLRGRARTQYDQLFTALQARAPGEQLKLSATVRTAAVRDLHGDRADLLVFLDQTSSRATDAQPSVSAAQVAVTARRIGGTWRITGLRPL